MTALLPGTGEGPKQFLYQMRGKQHNKWHGIIEELILFWGSKT